MDWRTVSDLPETYMLPGHDGQRRRANAFWLDGMLVEPPEPCTAWARLRGTDVLLLTHLHGDHTGGRFMPLPVATPATLGATLAVRGREWLVLRTPGHCPEHACLFDGHVLVAGDLWQRDRDAAVIPSIGGDLAAYCASLRMVAELRPAVVLCGHGAVDFDPADRMLRAADRRAP